MKYPRIISAIRTARWALLPGTMQAIRDSLAAHVTGRLAISPVPSRLAMEDDDGDPDAPPPPFEMIAPGVACVELCGIIGRKLSSLEMMCGGCDIAVVEQNLTLALADPGVSSVVLCIDSPGGVVTGVAEFASKIKSLRASSGKPIVGFIDGQGCSAAYWIACACDFLASTPSSDVGSIGVYMALVDESENWAAEGYKLVLIKAGKYKADGIPGSKITEEQIARWQADVDAIYSDFCAAVSAAHPNVAEESMQGQVFYGAAAEKAGLVDKIVPDLEAMVAEITAPVVS